MERFSKPPATEIARVAAPSFLSYSLRVSLLLEIAEKAHVSVEGVVRVLTREPVSYAIKERVLAVLDDLSPEETRVLQRFALAAVHDAIPRPGVATGEASEASDPEEPWTQAQERDDSAAAGADLVPATSPPNAQLAAPGAEAAHLVQLSSVLEDLAAAVRDLRSETDTERRERVDDLAVLIELISTGWQGLDRRLGRLERQLGRLEQLRVPAAPAVQRTQLAAPPPPPPVAEAPSAPAPRPAEPSTRARRDRLPLAAALALVGLVVGTVAVLQLVAGETETAGVSTPGAATLGRIGQPLTGEPTGPATRRPARTAPTTTRAASTAPARKAAPSTIRSAAPPTTSAVLGTQATEPSAPQETAPARTQRSAPSAPTAPAGTTAAEAQSSGFRPTREWAWAPVDGADYYSVRFVRGGTDLYRTSTEQPRLRLPDSVAFEPGSYRWIVRPGFGEPSENRIGAPIVDSTFSVE